MRGSHPSGDVYALSVPLTTTVSGLWRREQATGTWTELTLNSNPAGDRVIALACAPNGRIYMIKGAVNALKVFRSTP